MARRSSALVIGEVRVPSVRFQVYRDGELYVVFGGRLGVFHRGEEDTHNEETRTLKPKGAAPEGKEKTDSPLRSE